MSRLAGITQQIGDISPWQACGRVVALEGLRIDVEGLQGILKVGGLCEIHSDSDSGGASDGIGDKILCEVIGIRSKVAVVQPFHFVDGVAAGALVTATGRRSVLFPTMAWRGRIIDAFGKPLDDKGPLEQGSRPYALRRQAEPAHARRRLGQKLILGVKSIDSMASCCRGQRLGIFAGSGVGKSMTLAMIARNTEADAVVIALVGERGRELREFIEDYLGEEGLRRSVVVISTSDEAPLMRRQAAWSAMAVAEALRDKGQDVLFLMDSVTRMAIAQREIGLSAGEPPTQKGYPPSVFSMLPQLLERAGPGSTKSANHQGDITAIITVLVEGDDSNEPISDATRSILDGHVVLSRDIANRGRFPAMNVLESISRSLPGANSAEENELVNDARKVLTVYDRMEELIKLGAYRQGSDAEVDRAIEIYPRLDAFLSQAPQENPLASQELYANLAQALGRDVGQANDSNPQAAAGAAGGAGGPTGEQQ